MAASLGSRLIESATMRRRKRGWRQRSASPCHRHSNFCRDPARHALRPAYSFAAGSGAEHCASTSVRGRCSCCTGFLVHDVGTDPLHSKKHHPPKELSPRVHLVSLDPVSHVLFEKARLSTLGHAHPPRSNMSAHACVGRSVSCARGRLEYRLLLSTGRFVPVSGVL